MSLGVECFCITPHLLPLFSIRIYVSLVLIVLMTNLILFRVTTGVTVRNEAT